jgi:DNA-binding IclR family transcriptional regulator
VEPISEKRPPAYAITSVDHALRLVTALQLEGSLTVAAAAERLGVARSTAHRILQMLVYRDFARQDDGRVYRPGLLLELAAHSPSRTARLRRTALPHLQRLSDGFEESANLSIPAGVTTRFIASVECRRALRVTSREGMVYPLYPTTTGMLHLASLSDPELRQFLGSQPDLQHRPSVVQDVERVRRGGFAVNQQRTEKGLVAIGVPVRGESGELLAGLSVTMPTLRYDERRLDGIVTFLRAVGADLEADLRVS